MNPNLGDIRRGAEVGMPPSYAKLRVIWAACECCSSTRWTRAVRGKAEARYCPACAGSASRGRRPSVVTETGDRLCSVCEIEKPEKDFDLRRPGRRRAVCQKCRYAADRERHKANPEKSRAQAAAYRKARPEIGRNASLKYLYGMTIAEFDALSETQGGRCWICEGEPKGRLHVDHCHKTDMVRGLLCGPCNRMIGLAKDRTDVLERAIQYLERPPAYPKHLREPI